MARKYRHQAGRRAGLGLQCGGQIDGDGGFADPALAAGNAIIAILAKTPVHLYWRGCRPIFGWVRHYAQSKRK